MTLCKKMTNPIVSLFASILLISTPAAHSEEVYVHITGIVEKPGFYKVSTPVTIAELEKACGGWTEFGQPKRITLIRLQRQSNATSGDPGEPKSQIFKLDEIPTDDGKLVLKRHDVIFVPEKIYYAQ